MVVYNKGNKVLYFFTNDLPNTLVGWRCCILGFWRKKKLKRTTPAFMLNRLQPLIISISFVQNRGARGLQSVLGAKDVSTHPYPPWE